MPDPDRLDRTLGQLVTASSALAGGTIFFLRDCHGWYRATAVTLFVTVLCTSLPSSLLPSRSSKTKSIAVWVGLGLLLLGLGIAAVGGRWVW